MQFNPPALPPEPPPPPPPDASGWNTAPAESQWAWSVAPPAPPPLQGSRLHNRVVAVVAIVVSLAVVAGLVGVVTLVGVKHAAAPVVTPAASLPPEPTVPPEPTLSIPAEPTAPPVTDIRPLPSALPTGSLVAKVPWTALNNGVISVVPSSDGVDLTLLQLERRQWVPVPVPSASSALRLDATVTATTDSGGNHIGLACQTPDHEYGATFSIDGNGEWFMSYDWPGGPELLDNAQSGLIHDVKTANRLSAVCIEHSQRFEMLFAINGTVVGDEVVPEMTAEPMFPMLYICSCTGNESTHDSAIAVSSIPYSG